MAETGLTVESRQTLVVPSTGMDTSLGGGGGSLEQMVGIVIGWVS